MIKYLITGALALSLVGCAQTPREYEVNPDRMQSDQQLEVISDDPMLEEMEESQRGVTMLDPLAREVDALREHEDLSDMFSDRDRQQVTARELPLDEFVQTIFSDSLNANYIISTNLKDSDATVTLNLSEPVSSRRLFRMTRQLLDEQGIAITRREDTLYIVERDSGSRDNTVIGMGRRRADVPDTINPVIQIIPIRFGITASMERTLRGLSNARITPDFDQSAIFVEGRRNEIMRVIDLVNLLDVPAHRGKNVGMVELTYITPEEFTTKVTELLRAEGIRASVGHSSDTSLLMIPIHQVGAIALFSGELFMIERAEYWAEQIDRPSRGAEKRYYMYHPRNSRASDLGQSIAPLLGGVLEQSGDGDSGRSTGSAQPTGRQPVAGSQPSSGSQQRQRQQAASVVTEDLRMTVDERSNTLIFFTTGESYQSLLPIIRRLDVLPKQILLDATIAEVTLTDEFAQGFEFAFQSGKISGGTLGRLGVEGMGGLALNWRDNADQIIARLSASTNLVNVLSNPTLVVRDGVSASISVGNDIPTVGATTSDPIQSDRQTTVINYRKTGVNLRVTPTINAQGQVVLDIDQQISNTADSGPSIAGSPSIFERSIQTEVIAQSGQTILLGGLISENRSEGDSHVPGFARIPLVGHLFRGRSQSTEKTELVIFITPRVIENLDQWAEVRSSIAEGLTNLKIAD